MATDNENLRSILGVPTPSADSDNDTLRAIGGIPALKDGDATPGGDGLSATFRPAWKI